MMNHLRLKRLGIDTYHDSVVYMRRDSHVCRAEGFTAHTRVDVNAGDRTITATLNLVTGELLSQGEVGLSENAWARLGAADGDTVSVSYSKPIDSMSHVRAKVFGERLDLDDFQLVLTDIVTGHYSDIHLSSFITACAARALDTEEIIALTLGMINTGRRVRWSQYPIFDKHCVGGLPGNRTTPIVVAIAAACGLTIPKTSSRAITSPAGTADVMETLAPVNLDVPAMRRVVEVEGGCIIWGGAVDLSPADDILIRVERALDLDSEGQLVASVLSKKVAAGSSHLVIDMPVGSTAKIRNDTQAESLSRAIAEVARHFELHTRIIVSDGRQPVGNGIGPALEARDVLAVLRGEPDAPSDLRARGVALAGALLELAGNAAVGEGSKVASAAIDDRSAWTKFVAICKAQGGMREPPVAEFRHPVVSERTGRIQAVDNRRLARVAKLAGAPESKAAGLELHVKLDDEVEAGQPLYTLHSEAKGELAYATEFVISHPPIFRVS